LIVTGLVGLKRAGWGLLNVLTTPPIWSTVVILIVLDFAAYVAHVTMHKVPVFWRFHRVHHSDPAVDVTTALRQHPGETLIRYMFMALFALPLGASVASFAIYRLASALGAILEHANIKIPARLDDALSLITTWPTLHKAHHSRDQRLTDTNYGNIFSIWDRLFRTFTPVRQSSAVVYGLEGSDDPRLQTTRALLMTPFRRDALRSNHVEKPPGTSFAPEHSV
jgi:sterol desaturase/sphingolipid hydroxylase (fatty acid hydroxylase superfamily)